MNNIGLGTTLKKIVGDLQLQKAMNDPELRKTLEAFAVRDRLGEIDEAATLFKLQRRQVLKDRKPWEATANPFKEFPGTSSSAPRGAPAPKIQSAVPDTQDLGNPSTGVLTSVGVLAETGTHDPVKALDILRSVINTSRRAQGLSSA